MWVDLKTGLPNALKLVVGFNDLWGPNILKLVIMDKQKHTYYQRTSCLKNSTTFSIKLRGTQPPSLRGTQPPSLDYTTIKFKTLFSKSLSLPLGRRNPTTIIGLYHHQVQNIILQISLPPSRKEEPNHHHWIIPPSSSKHYSPNLSPSLSEGGTQPPSLDYTTIKFKTLFSKSLSLPLGRRNPTTIIGLYHHQVQNIILQISLPPSRKEILFFILFFFYCKHRWLETKQNNSDSTWNLFTIQLDGQRSRRHFLVQQ